MAPNSPLLAPSSGEMTKASPSATRAVWLGTSVVSSPLGVPPKGIFKLLWPLWVICQDRAILLECKSVKVNDRNVRCREDKGSQVKLFSKKSKNLCREVYHQHQLKGLDAPWLTLREPMDSTFCISATDGCVGHPG